MLEVDKQINDTVHELGGMYIRYSDDFMIILPDVPEIDAVKELKRIADMVKQAPRLTLEPSKTQYFHFENGVLTNVNDYGYENVPKPWIGYYWTATAGEGNKSNSLFFDLNTTRAVNNRYEAVKAMYRANGMQVRCVREK
jgi:hypothetical protein